MADIFVGVSDAYRVRSAIAASLGVGAVAVDSVGVTSADNLLDGRLMIERMGLAAAPIPEATYHAALAEVAGIRARLANARILDMSDVVQLGATLSVFLGQNLREAAGIGLSVDVLGRYLRHGSEEVRLDDLVVYGLGADAADVIGLAGTLQGAALFDQLLTDTIGAGDSITSAPLLLQVVADEQVSITATEALQMFYAGTLRDEVQITAVYPSISGAVTTWALNTRTGALTEYADYAFNSFAQLDGRYLGAADDGLYELAGDTDDGAAVISEIETGLAQIAGSRLTSFRAAYLAVRGSGQFVLRLETGNGKIYNYSVIADHMGTTKVHLGKGLRARYFSFTLISTGQDFDLESLEFVPIAARRRV